jgi:glycosyltransferase 2 family protein
MKKQILRWVILGGTLVFLAKALEQHWQEVANIRIDGIGWAILITATGVTLLAHTWAGWIWTWVLRDLNQPVDSSMFIQVYLKTNIAKYLPGNIWHHYGRILAAKNANVTPGAAALSVLLEPLLMAAAALIVVVLFGGQLATNFTTSFTTKVLQILSLVAILCVIHPRFLNLAISFLQRLKAKKSTNTISANNNTNPTESLAPATSIERYPLRPLLGELGFLILRGTGFILTLFALSPLHLHQIPLLLGAFSLAWLVGFVTPGAPGGLGVFEATMIFILQSRFPPAAVISAIGLYRLISILAETTGATLAWLDEHWINY